MGLSKTFLVHFEALEDPRQADHPNKRYDLKAMLVIAILIDNMKIRKTFL